jgi:sugar/nucleoside kinase (ribokinase family)
MAPTDSTPHPPVDVLGLGCVAVDDLLYAPAYPAPETKVRLRRRERQCGGLTGTALVAAARLGARCAFAGVLGDDEDSHFVVECFRREGIDTTYLRRRPGARPIHSTVIVDEDAQTRTVLFDLAGSVGAEPDHPPDEVIRAARVLYVDHYGIEGMTRAARVARAAGVPVVADLERDEWPGFHGLLALVDHLIVARAFAEKLTGAADPAAAVDRLWRDDRRAVVVTCGADGCWFRGEGEAGQECPAHQPQAGWAGHPEQWAGHPEQWAGHSCPAHHQPAFPVAVVDTTGCGDVFHGAYAASLARGVELAGRIRFASAAAAIKATRYGGQAGIPTRAAVEAFLQERDQT